MAVERSDRRFVARCLHVGSGGQSRNEQTETSRQKEVGDETEAGADVNCPTT